MNFHYSLCSNSNVTLSYSFLVFGTLYIYLEIILNKEIIVVQSAAVVVLDAVIIHFEYCVFCGLKLVLIFFSFVLFVFVCLFCAL